MKFLNTFDISKALLRLILPESTSLSSWQQKIKIDHVCKEADNSNCQKISNISDKLKDPSLDSQKALLYSKELDKLVKTNCTNCPNFEKCSTNEKQNYSLYSSLKKGYRIGTHLSKNTIRLFLVLHALDKENNCLEDISINLLAKEIGCHPKTIEACLTHLETNGFIQILPSYLHKHVSLCLLGYENLYASKKDGGISYLQMSKETLYSLLKLKNVNTLRFSLYVYLKTDDEVVRNRRLNPIYTSSTPVINLDASVGIPVFPRAYRSNSSLKSIINNELVQSSIKITPLKHDKRYHHKQLFCKLENIFHPKKLEDFQSQLETQIPALYKKFLKKEDFQDLNNLVKKYDVSNILFALDHVFDYYMLQKEPICIGSMIRVICRRDYINSYV